MLKKLLLISTQSELLPLIRNITDFLLHKNIVISKHPNPFKNNKLNIVKGGLEQKITYKILFNSFP